MNSVHPTNSNVLSLGSLTLPLFCAAIFVKKLEQPPEVIAKAINNLDLSTLSLELTEILLKLTPKEDEVCQLSCTDGE